MKPRPNEIVCSCTNFPDYVIYMNEAIQFILDTCNIFSQPYDHRGIWWCWSYSSADCFCGNWISGSNGSHTGRMSLQYLNNHILYMYTKMYTQSPWQPSLHLIVPTSLPHYYSVIYWSRQELSDWGIYSDSLLSASLTIIIITVMLAPAVWPDPC